MALQDREAEGVRRKGNHPTEFRVSDVTGSSFRIAEFGMRNDKKLVFKVQGAKCEVHNFYRQA